MKGYGNSILLREAGARGASGVLASGGVALLAGAAILFSAVNTIHQLNDGPAVSIQVKPWSWVSQIPFHRAQRLELPGEEILAKQLAAIAEDARKIQAQPITPASRETIARATSAIVGPKARPGRQRAVPAQKQVQAAAKVPVRAVTQDSVASMAAEMHRVRILHRALHTRFLASLSPLRSVDIQVAALEAQPKAAEPATPVRKAKGPSNSRPKAPRRENTYVVAEKDKLAPAVKAAPAPKARAATQALSRAQEPQQDVQPKQHQQPSLAAILPKQTELNLDTQPMPKPAEPAAAQVQVPRQAPLAAAQMETPNQESAQAEVRSQAASGKLGEQLFSLTTQLADAGRVASQIQWGQVSTQRPQTTEAREYSQLSAPQAMATQESVTTPSIPLSITITPTATRTQVAPVQASQPTVLATQAYGPEPVAAPPVAEEQAVLATQLPQSVPAAEAAPVEVPAPAAPVEPYVEAFDWKTPVHQAYWEPLTYEGTDQPASAGWRITHASSHQSTLSWSPIQGDSQSVPLISSNAARLLATLTGVEAQEQTGVIFGKVPAGWTVEFSGRAERPIYLDALNQPVAATATDQDRYFAFLNASPGAQLVHFLHAGGKKSGAVGIPVLERTSTFLDLTRIHTLALTGTVYDAGSVDARPMKKVQVRVVGQPGAAALTDGNGSFRIDAVSVLPGYPVYIETEAAQGFTHRYRVLPAAGSKIQLFRLSERQIQAWVGQLEGGVSAESGLVVAALPGLVARHGGGNLYPGVKTLFHNATLVPETYSVSAHGQMLVNEPLRNEASRFVSVQVPEGPMVVQVEGKNQRTVWSELVIASPGVVNLVGPY